MDKKLLEITPRDVIWYATKGEMPHEKWDSMSDVNRELGIPVPHLVRVCKGTRKSTRDYIWRYAEEGDIYGKNIM